MEEQPASESESPGPDDSIWGREVFYDAITPPAGPVPGPELVNAIREELAAQMATMDPAFVESVRTQAADFPPDELASISLGTISTP